MVNSAGGAGRCSAIETTTLARSDADLGPRAPIYFPPSETQKPAETPRNSTRAVISVDAVITGLAPPRVCGARRRGESVSGRSFRRALHGACAWRRWACWSWSVGEELSADLGGGADLEQAIGRRV